MATGCMMGKSMGPYRSPSRPKHVHDWTYDFVGPPMSCTLCWRCECGAVAGFWASIFNDVKQAFNIFGGKKDESLDCY